MSFDPEPLQRLLLWRLAVSDDGGEFLKNIKPRVDAAVRGPLLREKLIDEPKRKPPGGRQPSKFLQLTDQGWTWCRENVGAELGSPSRHGSVVLQRLMLLLHRYFENQEHTVSFPQFVSQSRGKSLYVAPDSSGDGRLEQWIREACLEIGNGAENVRVRLADLRPRVPGVAKDALDAKLLELERRGLLSLWPLDNPQEVKPEDRQAVVRTPAGSECHIVYFGGRSS